MAYLCGKGKYQRAWNDCIDKLTKHHREGLVGVTMKVYHAFFTCGIDTWAVVSDEVVPNIEEFQTPFIEGLPSSVTNFYSNIEQDIIKYYNCKADFTYNICNLYDGYDEHEIDKALQETTFYCVECKHFQSEELEAVMDDVLQWQMQSLECE